MTMQCASHCVYSFPRNQETFISISLVIIEQTVGGRYVVFDARKMGGTRTKVLDCNLAVG